MRVAMNQIFTSLVVSWIFRLCFVQSNDKTSEYFESVPHQQPYYVRDNDQNLVLPCVVSPKYANDPSYEKAWMFFSAVPKIITINDVNKMPEHYELDSSTCSGCYNLRIKRIKYDLNNGKFYCQIGKGSNPRVAPVAHVIVLVKPGYPSISKQLSYLSESSLGRLECETAGGNPPPKISWFFSNGTDVTSYAQQTNATDLIRPTTSLLQWPVSSQDHKARVFCQVWNEAMQPSDPPLQAQSRILNVTFAPQVQVGPASPYNIIVGQPATLLCDAIANPPIERYTWKFKDRVLERATYGTNTFHIQSISRAMTGNYSCIVENSEKKGSGSIEVNVLYAPEVTIAPEVRVAVGTKVTLKCTADANPPVTNFMWSLPDGRNFEGSALNVEAVSLKDQGNYSCTAKNNLVPTSGTTIVGSATKSTMLIVEHAPGRATIWPADVVGSTASVVVVSSTTNLTCTSSDPGSPPAVYRWRRPSDADFEHFAKPVLTIYDTKLSDAGLYSCLPSNEIGKGEIGTYNLTVYDPAKIKTHLKPDDTATENELNYSLSCTAQGFPAPNISWYKDAETIHDDDHWQMSSEVLSDSRCQFGENCLVQVRGTLKWLDGIRWSDKGEIACGAYNGAGQMDYSKTTLNVYHRPVIINDPNRPFVAAEIGQRIEIQCRASSKPEPTFAWYKNGEPLPSSYDYTIASQRNQSWPDLHESTLIIRRVTEADLSDYVCKATNKFGSGSFIFTVQGKTKPMAPLEFRSVYQSHQWIVVSWKPGFNGGSAQTFVIEVVYPHDLPNQLIEVTENVSAYRFKRHTKIESAEPFVLNITSDIAPSAPYKLRIKSKNDLGETDWTPYTTVWSSDAPLDLSVPKVVQATFDPSTATLEFQPMNLDALVFCLLIYRKENVLNGRYSSYGCVDPTKRVDNLLDPGTSLKIRFCYRKNLECGEPHEIVTSSHPLHAGISWEILAAACVALLVLVVFCASVFVVCRRRRFKRTKARQHQQTKLANNSYKRDYEMEDNQNNRPKTISGPYLTEKTPGPLSGFGSLDKRTLTAGSKDSGVFTTYAGSMVNYQVDPTAFASSYGSDRADGQLFYNSNPVSRRPSYEENAGGNGWAPNMHVQSSSQLNGNSNDARHYIPSSTRDSYDRTSSSSLNYGAIGAAGDVDMNPNPNNSHGQDAASAGSSSFSTPSQRRIIREIIV